MTSSNNQVRKPNNNKTHFYDFHSEIIETTSGKPVWELSFEEYFTLKEKSKKSDLKKFRSAIESEFLFLLKVAMQAGKSVPFKNIQYYCLKTNIFLQSRKIQ